jgi:hypothetical protein
MVADPGASIDAKMRAFGDNLVSRVVGFTVRFFVLFAAALAFVLLLVASVLELVLWPLVPLAGIALIVKGLL